MPAGNQNQASPVGGEHSRKETFKKLTAAQQETLDHLDLLANGLQLFGTLALLSLYLTC